MLEPQQIIENDYLECRCSLLEIAAMFDRYDIAVLENERPTKNAEKLDCLREALAMLAEPSSSADRAEQLLNLFAKV